MTMTSEAAPSGGWTCNALAEMPPQGLLDEAALAVALAVAKRTIRRMAKRGELPAPVRFAGRATWSVGAVLRHVEALAEAAERDARRERERLARLMPT